MTLVNAMTVDVEDYFQVSAFERYIDRSQWNIIQPRVEHNMNVILGLFDEFNVEATFFTLGWVAERFPSLVRSIVDNGHEIASHGWSHVRVTQQDEKAFRDDVTRTKSLLEDVAGTEVRGYRAASYSIGAANLWALDVLSETGHAYSSSIFPIKHDLYGMPDAPRFGFRPNDDSFVEFPVTTVRLGSKNLPFSGGGWFRLLPYVVSKAAITRVNTIDREPVIFYFHPWEIDSDQPTQVGIDLKTRFRHYLNLDRMEGRLRRLCHDFSWGRMDEILYEPFAEKLTEAA